VFGGGTGLDLILYLPDEFDARANHLAEGVEVGDPADVADRAVLCALARTDQKAWDLQLQENDGVFYLAPGEQDQHAVFRDVCGPAAGDDPASPVADRKGIRSRHARGASPLRRSCGHCKPLPPGGLIPELFVGIMG